LEESWRITPFEYAELHGIELEEGFAELLRTHDYEVFEFPPLSVRACITWRCRNCGRGLVLHQRSARYLKRYISQRPCSYWVMVGALR
jgi:hypothetical protein